MGDGVGKRVGIVNTESLPGQEELKQQSPEQRVENARNNATPEVRVPFVPWPQVEYLVGGSDGGEVSKCNAWIVMGRDRTGNYADSTVSELARARWTHDQETSQPEPAGLTLEDRVLRSRRSLDATGMVSNINLDGPPSGWGPTGANYCGSIDLVCGRLSNDASGKLLSKGLKGLEVQPNFGTDAARIYISQRSNVDYAFHLAEGRVGSPEGRSTVAMKADSIRIIGREGIKLITRTDEFNSLAYHGKNAGKIVGVKGIDLIAGNNDANMQPLVKGYALINCLHEIIGEINSLGGQIVRLSAHVQMLASDYGNHVHLTQGLLGPTTEWPIAPALCQQIVNTCQDIPQQILEIGTNLLRGIGQTYLGQPRLEGSAGPDDPDHHEEYICSRYNHTN